MKWVQGETLVSRAPYTALYTDDGRIELGRYWHTVSGFVPDTTRNNASPKPTEREARLWILKKVKAEVAALIRAEKACSTQNPVEQPASGPAPALSTVKPKTNNHEH